MPRQNYFEMLTQLQIEPYLQNRRLNDSGENMVNMALAGWKLAKDMDLGAANGNSTERARIQSELALYPDMEATMTDPAKRSREARAMQDIAIGQLDTMIDLMKKDGINSCSMAEVRDFAKILRLSVPTVKSRLQKKGVTIREVPRVQVTSFLLGKNEMEAISKNLETVRNTPEVRYPNQKSVKTLYDLIGLIDGLPVSNWPSLQHDLADRLNKRCDAIGTSFSSVNTPFGHAVFSLATTGKTKVFDSDANREKYDLSLRAAELEAQLDLATKAELPDGFKRDPKHAEKDISELLALFGDNARAIAFYSDRMKLNPPYEPPTAKAKYIVVCAECGTVCDFSSYEEATRINRCQNGHKLFDVCPRPTCKKPYLRTMTSCPNCHLVFAALADFEPAIDAANSALRRNDPDAARDALDRARKIKDWDPRIKTTSGALEKLEQQIRKPMAEIRKLMKDGLYVTADAELKKLQTQHPGMSFSQLSDEIRKKLDWADAEVLRAGPLKDAQKTPILMNVLREVKDYKGITLPAPPPVQNLKIERIENETQWSLSWSCHPDPDPDTSFTVVRKLNEKPSGISDGKKLRQGIKRNSYVDKTAEPGVEYGYAVFAVRAGQASQPVARVQVGLHPELNPDEINITVEKDACTLSWVLPKNCVGVRILRGEAHTPCKLPHPGENWKISRATGSFFRDATVKRGMNYRYRLYTLWLDPDGKEQESDEGVLTESICVEDRPQPVKLSVQVSPETHSVKVSWEPLPGRTLLLVRTPAGNVFRRDESYRQSEFPADSEQIWSGNADSGHYNYTENPNEAYYITALVSFGAGYIAGESACVSTLSPCRISSMEISGGKLLWKAELPPGASEIRYILKTRKDGEPAPSCEENWYLSAQTRQTRNNLFDGETNAEEGIMQLIVTAMVRKDGVEFFTPAATRELRNLPKISLRYSTDMGGRGFLCRARAPVLRIRSGDGRPLPKLELRTNTEGKILLSPSDGNLLLVEVKANTPSPAAIELPEHIFDPVPRGGYIRLFLADEGDEQKYEQPISESSMKKP